MTFKKRLTPAPCICGASFSENDDIIFCSECGEPYHRKCWDKAGKKCKVHNCSGQESKLWAQLEYFLTQLFDFKQTDLSNHCSNCNATISYLDRYCSVCGLEVNSKKAQNAFVLYPFAKAVQYNHKLILIIISAVLLVTINSTAAIASTAINSAISNISSPPSIAYPDENARVTRTATSQPTSPPPPKPTHTRIPSTPIPSATPSTFQIPEDYKCPDLKGVTLYVGAKATVAFDKVSMRSYAQVPNVWDENIIEILDKGDKVTIIGGPICSHDGTWWKIQTQQGKVVGWMREFLPDKRLIKLRN